MHAVRSVCAAAAAAAAARAAGAAAADDDDGVGDGNMSEQATKSFSPAADIFHFLSIQITIDILSSELTVKTIKLLT